jgi:enoyl-CoA hydratase
VRLENVDGVVLLRMEAGKANALGPEFLAALERTLEEAEAQGAPALVITGYGAYFSAGLDLPALQPLSRPEMKALIATFCRTMLRLFSMPLPVVAAVNGHAVAGGCVLALQADVRILAEGEARFGLKEAQLGIGLPALVVETLRSQVPFTSLVPVALEGHLFAPAEALRLGLVEAVVPPERLLPAAIARGQELARVPRTAYAQIKGALREPVRRRIRHGADADEAWLDSWFSEEGRRRVGAMVEELAKRKVG